MPLDTAGLDSLDLDVTAKFTLIVSNQDRGTILQSEPCDIFPRHENGVALGAGERVRLPVDQAVELFSASGG
jgi:hypothetical protein